MKKNIGKIIALLLCVSFGINLMPVFAANESVRKFEPAEYNKAVSMLNDLGILEDKYFVSYDSSVMMTRGEFASLAVSVMGFYDDAKATTFSQKFSDVSADTEYAKEINFATSLGLFNGVSDTRFAPDEPVYITQAVKVAVSMLGYKEMAEYKGGYPTGYLAIARDTDILDGINLNNSTPALRGNIIILMYNSLFADVMKISGVEGDSFSFEITEDDNILSIYHKIYEGEGIVTSNCEYSIVGDVEDANYISVNGVRYYTDSIRALGSVGKNVKYYYKKNSTTNEIITLREYENDIVNINASDNYTFDYSKGVYTVLGNEEDYIFKLSGYDIVYNYGYIDGSVPINYEDILTPKSGTITLIDNNNDKIYDVVIIEEADVLLFGSYDAYNEKIYDAYDRAYDIDINKYKTVQIKDTSGNEVDFSKLGTNTVFMVYESFDSQNLKLVVCQDYIDGQVSEISEDGIIVNNISYTFSAVSRISGLPSGTTYGDIITPGKSYVFYLDEHNKIVYHETKATLNTGYILDVASAGSGINKRICAHVYTSDDKLVEYSLTDNVKIETINGRKSCKASQVKAELLDYANANYGAGVNPNTRLFVQYSLSDNKISTIVLPYVIRTKEEYNNPPSNYSFFKLDYILSEFKTVGGIHIGTEGAPEEYYRVGYIPSNNSAGFVMTMASDCQIVYVPEFLNSSYTEANFNIQPVNKMAKDAYVYYHPQFVGIDNQIEAYSTNREVRLIDNIVWIKKNGHASHLENTAEDNAVVTNVSKVVSEDGDPLVKISVLESKTKYDLFSDNLEIASRSTFGDTSLPGSDSGSTLVSPTLHPDKKVIVPGDVIRFSKNADGYIEDIALMYDSENDMISYRDVKLFTTPNAKYRHTCGEVLDKYGDYSLLEVYGSSLSVKNIEAHKVSSFFRIYVYDYKEKDARIGTAADISIGDKVYFSMWYSSSKDGEIVIFKGKGEEK